MTIGNICNREVVPKVITVGDIMTPELITAPGRCR